MTQPTLINLHLNEYIQGSNYYLFAVNLGRSRGRSNALIYPIDSMFKKKFFEQSFEYDKKNKSNEKHEQNKSHVNANCNSNQKWNNYK